MHLLCKKEEEIRKYTCISSFLGEKHTVRIIQGMMKLVIYRGWVETGGKEKEKGDTLLWVCIFCTILTFGTMLMFHILKNKEDQLGQGEKLRTEIELNCISND